MSPELSIIIVQYKIPELLQKCIESIYRHAGDVALEVIVVNNDIEDVSKAPITSLYPQVKWIDAGYNAGFSRANNIGIRHAIGEYILILNPDTEVREEFFRSFIAFYKAQDIAGSLGLLGCRIISSVDGSLLIGSGIGFPSVAKIIKANPLYIYFTRSLSSDKEKPYDPYVIHYQNHEVDFLSGACEMIKREKVLQKQLFFDEDFFLYSEDVEWSYRVRKAGYKNYFCAEIEVYHVNSASTGSSKNKFFQMQISSYLYYLKSHTVPGYLYYGLVLSLNFISDIFLLKRAGQMDEYQSQKEQYNVFKRYFLYILRRYRLSSEAGKPYLQYAAKDQK